jgi:hypothetical protein
VSCGLRMGTETTVLAMALGDLALRSTLAWETRQTYMLAHTSLFVSYANELSSSTASVGVQDGETGGLKADQGDAPTGPYWVWRQVLNPPNASVVGCPAGLTINLHKLPRGGPASRCIMTPEGCVRDKARLMRGLTSC